MDRTTIYLVDDEPAVLKALARVLTVSDFNVRTFDSSTDFLDGHDPTAPGCVVLDFSMPGLNGLELQQELTARGSLLPIVFLTGRGDIPPASKL